MNYTIEQLRPKRYPENKPLCGEHKSLWWMDKDGYVDTYFSDGFINNEPRWFIDIPGAPAEVEPLPYPECKPDRAGNYMAHNKLSDRWFELYWYGKDYFSWRVLVDYFINLPLEPESEEEDNIIYTTGIGDYAAHIEKDCGGFKIFGRTPGGGGFHIPDSHAKRMFLAGLEALGYVVTLTPEEPEILPCPNSCGGTVYFDQSKDCIRCAHCGMCGPRWDLDGAKWNSLPRRE